MGHPSAKLEVPPGKEAASPRSQAIATQLARLSVQLPQAAVGPAQCDSLNGSRSFQQGLWKFRPHGPLDLCHVAVDRVDAK